MVRKLSAARKFQIIDAAITLFISKGYNQTSMRDIATAAEVSLGNIYNYFASKDELLTEIAGLEEQELSEIVDVLGSAGNPGELMDQFIDSYFLYFCRPENVLLSLEILSEAIRNPAIEQIFTHNQKQLEDALAKFLTIALHQESGQRPGSAKQQARMVLDQLEGYALRTYRFYQGKKVEQAPDELKQFIRSALGMSD